MMHGEAFWAFHVLPRFGIKAKDEGERLRKSNGNLISIHKKSMALYGLSYFQELEKK